MIDYQSHFYYEKHNREEKREHSFNLLSVCGFLQILCLDRKILWSILEKMWNPSYLRNPEFISSNMNIIKYRTMTRVNRGIAQGY